MNTMENKKLATVRRLCTAVERIADALESQAGPELALAELCESTPFVVSWEAAVQVIAETCKGAELCGPGGCPMYEWCQENLRNAQAPAKWTTMEG